MSGPTITVNGPSVPTDGVSVATADCPPGYTVTSGGYTSETTHAYSGPGDGGHPNSTNTGWVIPTPLDPTPGAAIHAWAICLPFG
ncbi:hypothetical protein [Streptomyces laurentii]|uniref:hypothetical protein n=1 Tax=Streptomyces laurentii TaxID=39478 RepID=UPI003681A66B